MKIASSLVPILLGDVNGQRSDSRPSDKKGKNSKNLRYTNLWQENGYDQSLDDCSAQAEATGATFKAKGEGTTAGSIKLSNYQNNQHCKHVVQAAETCTAIRVNFKNVAVEACAYGDSVGTCSCDQFRFGFDPDGDGSHEELLSPGNCFCNDPKNCDTRIGGDGLDSGNSFAEDMDNFPSYYSYDWQQLSDGFSVNGNKFTFYFGSDDTIYGGHVEVDWECVEGEVTTLGWTTTQWQSTSTSNWRTTSEPITYYDPTTTYYYVPTTYSSVPDTTSVSTTSTSFNWETYTTHPHKPYCLPRIVFTDRLCKPDGKGGFLNEWADEERKAKFPRVATYEDAVATKTHWSYRLGQWVIAGLEGGVALGAGYAGENGHGHVTKNENATWDGKPPCANYGAILMCQETGIEPPEEPKPIGDFAEAVRTGIDKGLENDIYTFSRKPGTITNGALMRKGQWKRWMTKFINRWEEERNNDRKCIADKFPSPASIKKEILGSDCALDLTTVDKICDNMDAFIAWAFGDCRSNAQTSHLEFRCRRIREIRGDIQAIAAASIKDDMEKANLEIIKHNEEMNKASKGRYKEAQGKGSRKNKHHKGRKPARKSNRK